MCAASALWADEALTIMQKNDALPQAQSISQSSVLTVTKSGRSETKEFTTVMKKDGRKKRSRISFTYPTKMEFLSWDVPGEDNRQWIKLSSGKVRKIASSEKSKPWMNSHFAYEDIATNYIEDSEYRMLAPQSVDGVDCYRIEAVKIRGQKVYSKREMYLGKEDLLVRRVDFYENGMHTKTLVFSDYKTVSGVAIAHRMTMERTDGKGKSVLQIKNAVVNAAVSDRVLTQEGF